MDADEIMNHLHEEAHGPRFTAEYDQTKSAMRELLAYAVMAAQAEDNETFLHAGMNASQIIGRMDHTGLVLLVGELSATLAAKYLQDVEAGRA